MVTGDTGRVDPGRQREGVKPHRHPVADALSHRRRRIDRQQVGDRPLVGGRPGDHLDPIVLGGI